MRTIVLAAMVLTLAAASSATAAPNILLYNQNIGCEGSTEYYPAALAALGLAFTEINMDDDFYAALTNGTDWDIVLVDQYSDGNFGSPTLRALTEYIAGGGSCILNTCVLDSTLAAYFGASRLGSYITPLPVYRWEPSHPIFTTPNAITDADLVPIKNPCYIDGFNLYPDATGLMVAGYTSAPTASQTAIVVGNEGRTILLGFTPGLFGPAMEKFLENCITFVAPHPRPLRVMCSSLTPAAGDAFTVDVDVQPLTQAFDAWGCIFGPGPVAYSFVIGNPAALQSGTYPLVTGIPGLPVEYSARLLNITVPPGVAGEYTLFIELTSVNFDPLVPIEGYSSVKTVTVH